MFKYVLAGVLLMGVSAQALAQEFKTQLDAVSKLIVENKNNPKAVAPKVKEYLKMYKKGADAIAALGRAFLHAKDAANAAKYAEQDI